MVRGNASGLRISSSDLPIVIGMIARGDRHHDIAAWFGINQGRIKDAKDGKYGPPKTSPRTQLPPKGPPGIKGRRLRAAIDSALAKLVSGDNVGGIEVLKMAVSDYDVDET